MNYEEQLAFIKSLGLIPTGFEGKWSNGKYIVTIAFINDAVIITNVSKNE